MEENFTQENPSDKSLDAIRATAISNRVKSIHNEYKGKGFGGKSVVRSMPSRIFRVAATVLLVMLTITVVQVVLVDRNKLYDSQYQEFQPVVERSAEGSGYVMERLIQNRKYAEALSIFSKIPQPSNAEIFYAGLANLELSFNADAIIFFRRVLENNIEQRTTTFNDDAEYYLALAYLKNDELSEAHKAFQKIHDNPDHLYHEKVSSYFLLRLKFLEFKSR